MVFDDFIGITMTISQTELNQQLKSAGIGINSLENPANTSHETEMKSPCHCFEKPATLHRC